MKLKPHKCANKDCKMELLQAKCVDMLRLPPSIGDLLICGGCGAISKVTLEGTEMLEDKEFNELSEDEKKDISFAVRAVKKQLRRN